MTATAIESASRVLANKAGTVVDLFAGVGGLTHGLKRSGFTIKAGIDIDPKCKFAYETNNDSEYLQRDIRALTGNDIRTLFDHNHPQILVGCAPCQPFSSYAYKREHPDWSLLGEFSRLIESTLPEIVSMENVPSLLSFRKGTVFRTFRDRLESLGYHVSERVVYAPHYGVPQRRKRLILLASQLGPIKLTADQAWNREDVSVRSAIGYLRSIQAGEQDSEDPLHYASSLSEKNLLRIRQSSPGGTWRDWEEHLLAPCHQRASGKTYSSVYGRMTWEEPSPTITTQFYGFGNGRFGHPEQDRALSLREGAILQSFPEDYKFTPSDSKIEFKTLGRLIGNAVPVRLGEMIGQSIAAHLEDVNG